MEGTANTKMVFQMSGWGALAFGLMSLSLEKAEVNGGDPACPHPHIITVVSLIASSFQPQRISLRQHWGITVVHIPVPEIKSFL